MKAKAKLFVISIHFFSKRLKILYEQSSEDLFEDLLKEPDEITLKRKQIRENLMVLEQAYKVCSLNLSGKKVSDRGFLSHVSSILAFCAFCLKFLLYYSDFG